MKIIQPYARIIDINTPAMGRELLRRVEWFARISHRAEDAQTNESWERFIKFVVMQKGDWSVTEHCSVSVDAVVDRGITHEWVRHRIAAYTQESTRFVNYAKKMPPAFIYPIVGVECEHCLAGSEPLMENIEPRDGRVEEVWNPNWIHVADAGRYRVLHRTNIFAHLCAYDKYWLQSIDIAEQAYKGLLNKGWRPQEARSVFPNALASRLTITYNLRMWRHFFMMRTTAEAHPQMRQVTIPLLEEFKRNIPILFDDIAPNLSQAESIARAR